MAIGAVGIAMIAFLVWIVPSWAGATISIIQAKEYPSRPLKAFIYVGEVIDYDLLLNGNAVGSSAKVTWTLSNGSLATITNEGVLTANGKGSLRITATYKNGSDRASSSYTVKIKQNVTSVEMS